MDKSIQPTETALVDYLGIMFKHWAQLHQFVMETYPLGIAEWNFPGKKFGWSFRIKDKKRAIIYLLPRIGFFKVAFVFGQKAANEVLESDVSDHIKYELQNAIPYAEGRGFSLDVKDEFPLDDIKKLIIIKLKH